jgi:hypothetical protein
MDDNTTDALQELVNTAGENDLDQMSDGPISISCPEMKDAENPNEEAIEAYKFQIQQDIVNVLSNEIVKRESWRRLYEVLWWNIYSLYMSGNRTTTTPTRSKIFVPIAFQLIEIATPKLISFMSNNDTIFDVEPDDVKDRPIADNIQKLVSDQLQQNNFSDTYENFIKQLLLYGTSYLYVDYKVKWDWVWERVAVKNTTPDEFGINHTDITYENQKNYKITERRPNITFIDVLDVFPQQDHAKVEDQYPGVCIRRFLDRKEFERMCDGPQPYFGNKEKALATGTTQKFQESRQFRKVARGEVATHSPTDIELLEWWMKYDLDGDGIDEECQIIIANRQIVVRAVANPYYHQKRPLIKVNFCKVPGEWYGIGLIEPVMSLINQLTTVRRQRLDNITLILNRMWKVKSTADVDPTKLIATPNGIILVDNMDDIMPLEVQDVTQSSYQDCNQILGDIFSATVPQSLTGSIDDMKSTGSIGVGAVRANIAQALEKFATAAKAIEDEGIKKVLDLCYSLDLQYLNSDEVIRAFYGKLFPDPSIVTPEMIRANVTFRMTVLSEMVNTDVKIAQCQAFYSLANQQFTPDTNQAILRQIWGLMGNDEDIINVIGAATANPGGQIPVGALTGNVPPEQIQPIQPNAAPNGINQPNQGAVPGAAPAAPALGKPAPAAIAPSATAAQGATILKQAMGGQMAPTLKGVRPIPTMTGSE